MDSRLRGNDNVFTRRTSSLIGKFIMPVAFNKAMYPEVKQWLVDNSKDKHLPEPIKQDLLRFERLNDTEKEQLQKALLTLPELPDVLQQFMPDRLSTLPVELLDMVGKHLTPKDKRRDRKSTRLNSSHSQIS